MFLAYGSTTLPFHHLNCPLLSPVAGDGWGEKWVPVVLYNIFPAIPAFIHMTRGRPSPKPNQIYTQGTWNWWKEREGDCQMIILWGWPCKGSHSSWIWKVEESQLQGRKRIRQMHRAWLKLEVTLFPGSRPFLDLLLPLDAMKYSL